MAGLLHQAILDNADRYLTSGESLSHEDFTRRWSSEVVRLQDAAFSHIKNRMDSGASFDESARNYLTVSLGINSDTITEYNAQQTAAIASLRSDLSANGESRVEFHSISELLSETEQQDLNARYLQELALRFQPDAAADLVRALLLQKFDGWHVSALSLPGLSEQRHQAFLEYFRQSQRSTTGSGTAPTPTPEVSETIDETTVPSYITGCFWIPLSRRLFWNILAIRNWRHYTSRKQLRIMYHGWLNRMLNWWR